MKLWFSQYKRRIIPLVIGIVCLLLAGFGVYHWSVMRINNNAVAAFNANAKIYNASDDHNIDMLIAAQRQVDAQFNDALQFDMLTLPSTQHTIEANAQASKQFSDQLEQELNQQTNGTPDSDKKSDSTDNTQSSSATKKAQEKQKVDQVLNNNTTTNTNVIPDTNQTTSSNNTAHPW